MTKTQKKLGIEVVIIASLYIVYTISRNVSEVSEKVAFSHGIFLKPVVLFKSFRIADSNEFYDEFVFRGTFAASLEPGKFHFPTIQECASGEEAWLDTSGAEGVSKPAPSLILVPAEGGAGH